MSVDHIMNDNSSRPQTSPCGEEAVCCDLETLPMPEELSDHGDAYHISLLANYPDSEETRFFLTPEACGYVSCSPYRVPIARLAAAQAAIKASKK